MKSAPRRFVSSIARMLRRVLYGKPTGVPTETYQRRLDVCHGCPRIDRTLAHHPRCSVCNCFLVLKASISTESCPEGRWPGDNP